MSRTRLEWAQWMTAKGIFAFIVDANGKRPLGGNSWYARNTDDPDLLAEWFGMSENCNYGLWLNADHVVIDLDVKPGVNGVEQFAKICKENGIDNWMFGLDTFIVETPSGGYHLYFKTPWPCANKNSFGDGIDVRGAVGYVVGPGSQDKRGEWAIMDENAEIADCPEWLLDFMVQPGMKDPDRHVAMVEMDLPVNVEYAAEYLLTADPAIEGQNGDDYTYELCCHLRDLGISEEQAFLLLTDESKGPSWNQRCNPPWEDGHLQIKLKNSYNFAQNRPGNKAASLVDGHFDQCWPEGGYGLTAEKIADHFEPKTGLSLVVNNVTEDDPEIPVGKLYDSESVDDPIDKIEKRLWYGFQEFMAIERVREYVIKDWLIAHGITALLAKRGTGKSTIALDLGAHLALDMPWHDIPIMKGWNVVYICGEDDEGMILNARAWAEYHGKAPSNTRFKFAADIIKMTRRSVLRPRVAEIKAWAGDARCVVILDTWARATTGWNTNAQEEMDQAFTNAEDLAAALNGPMIACFHPPKNAKDLTIRGSAVQEDASSGIWWLEDSGDGVKLTIGRAKGKGFGEYRKFRFDKVDLGELDYFKEPLEGIVPVCTGGITDEERVKSLTKRDELKEAWAIAVVGVETFSMEADNPYEVKGDALNRNQVGDFIETVYKDKGDKEHADEFIRRYMQKLIDLKANGLGKKSGAIQKHLKNLLTDDRTDIILDNNTRVEIGGTTASPVFVVHYDMQKADKKNGE